MYIYEFLSKTATRLGLYNISEIYHRVYHKITHYKANKISWGDEIEITLR